MNVRESIVSSVRNVLSNKARAILTMLGIIIGIASVIIITSIGAGTSASMTSQFSKMGIGRLSISPAMSFQNFSRSDQLMMKDYQLLATNDQVKYISPMVSTNQHMKEVNPRNTVSAALTGCSADYFYISNPTLLYGRFITDSDVSSATNVAVITDTAAEAAFGFAGESAIGRSISVSTRRGTKIYNVVGIVQDQSASTTPITSNQYTAQITLPVTTLMKLMGTNFISNIQVIVTDPNNADLIGNELINMLNTERKTTGKYQVVNMMQIMDTINSMLGMITAVFAVVAGISLLVGGIGVMNIMLVTVTERTREIGIRKSIGARNVDILTQFLIEAVFITVLGGILGIVVGFIGGKIAGVFGVTTIVSPLAVLLAVGFSSLIGIVFGVYPANKAAKLDPIEALRYE